MKYHDEEWGRPSRSDQHLFEMLILEGAQAGLSWSTILNKREGYRAAFHEFDVVSVSEMTTDECEGLRGNEKIIRNRLKIYSAVSNAKAFLEIQAEHGSFADFLWSYVDGKPILNSFQTVTNVPVDSEISRKLSKDLKRRGFKFVGPTIMYAYMQAVGLVNDHVSTCFLHQKRPS